MQNISNKEKMIYAVCTNPSSYLEKCIKLFWLNAIKAKGFHGFHEAWLNLDGENLDPLKCAELMQNKNRRERKVLFYAAFNGIAPNIVEGFERSNTWTDYAFDVLKAQWQNQKPLTCAIEPNVIFQVAEAWLNQTKNKKSDERAFTIEGLLHRAGIIDHPSQVHGTNIEYITGDKFMTFYMLKECDS